MQELCLVVQPGRHHSTQHCANGEFMLEYAKGYAGIGSVSATARRVRSQQHQRFVLHVQKAAFESPYAEGAASVTMYIVHRCTLCGISATSGTYLHAPFQGTPSSRFSIRVGEGWLMWFSLLELPHPFSYVSESTIPHVLDSLVCPSSF
jgi:hypothetical protein